MFDPVLSELILQVRNLQARVVDLETAEVIPSQLQASDGDPNPALSADASGNLTAVAALELSAGTSVNEFSIDDTLAGDSDDAVPTEQAVKKYADDIDAKTGAFGCAFLAWNDVDDANATGNAIAVTVDFDTEVFDLGGDFAADTLTAPATGKYLLLANVKLYNLGAAATIGELFFVTSNRTYYMGEINVGAARSSSNRIVLQGHCIADMDVSDTAFVRVTVTGGTQSVGIESGSGSAIVTYFCGKRIA